MGQGSEAGVRGQRVSAMFAGLAWLLSYSL